MNQFTPAAHHPPILRIPQPVVYIFLSPCLRPGLIIRHNIYHYPLLSASSKKSLHRKDADFCFGFNKLILYALCAFSLLGKSERQSFSLCVIILIAKHIAMKVKTPEKHKYSKNYIRQCNEAIAIAFPFCPFFVFLEIFKILVIPGYK